MVRIRLVGGLITPDQLVALAAVAAEHGHPDLHLTGRANLQLRGLPLIDGALPPALVSSLRATGLVPTPSHDLVRNILVSPATGLSGGRADLRVIAAELDRLLCSSPRLADLPGRFLFVLDDGRGDLLDRTMDLGLVALDRHSAQVRVGSSGWGPVVDLADAPAVLIDLALTFLDHRGSGSSAAWHVDELDEPLHPAADRNPRAHVHADPLPYGDVAHGHHVEVPDGVLTPTAVGTLLQLAEGCDSLIVTPWNGVLVPEAAA